MSLSRQSNNAPPYAVAFSIEDLILIRCWADRRGLQLSVAIDQVVDGAEFEEMLIVAPQNRERRTLTLWRTQANVYAQTPEGRPRAFATLKDLLEALNPAQPRQRTPWHRRLGLTA